MWLIENVHWKAQIITWGVAFPPQYSNGFFAKNSYVFTFFFFPYQPHERGNILSHFCIWEILKLREWIRDRTKLSSSDLFDFCFSTSYPRWCCFSWSPESHQMLCLLPEPMLFNLSAKVMKLACIRLAFLLLMDGTLLTGQWPCHRNCKIFWLLLLFFYKYLVFLSHFFKKCMAIYKKMPLTRKIISIRNR